MSGPLEGIRVFDLTVWMVGPWASMMLGSLGAEIIHVEQPGIPLEKRGAGVPPTLNGTSVGYVTWNMNKRGLYLDLKEEKDRDYAYQFIKQCDVFLMNMRPGVAERLGMDYETLHELNPRLIYCVINGWGDTGPMAKQPGADGQVQGFSGFWSLNGHEGRPAEFYRHYTQLDANTGNYAVQAILMALLARESTGVGQRIDVTMIQAAMSLQTVALTRYLRTGQLPEPLGSAAANRAPDQAFLCQDSRYIGISVQGEAEWARFCQVIKRPDLIQNQRFSNNQLRVQNRTELADEIQRRIIRYPQYQWVRLFAEAGLSVGYPMSFEELRYHEQALANEYLLTIPTSAWGTLTTGGPPWHFSRTPAQWFRTPLPGEHTEEIFVEFDIER